jgi:hypothetical protein
VRSKSHPDDWVTAVAHEYLGEVLGAARCLELTDHGNRRRKGLLSMGEWAALMVPDDLLGSEFDPETDQLLPVRYADYAQVSMNIRILTATIAVRFSQELTLVGPRKPMKQLHSLWSDDWRFSQSTEEKWA